jgi:excisionase family DNA binding protein
VLRIALEEFAAGHVVAIEPLHDEVSTQEAADLLRVSRPYVVKLIENGEIPCRKVGPRRRLRLEDVLEYREARDMRRHTALRDLSRLSQELGLD